MKDFYKVILGLLWQINIWITERRSLCAQWWRQRPEVNLLQCICVVRSADFRHRFSAVLSFISALYLVVYFLRRHHERHPRCEAVCHQNDREQRARDEGSAHGPRNGEIYADWSPYRPRYEPNY